MKHYNQPKTQVLQVVNSSIICTSGPAPAPARGELGKMTRVYVEW